MHITSGRWQLGLALALFTALLWGSLPIALKLLLDDMDAYTITWYRFLTAAVLLGAFQIRHGTLPALHRVTSTGWILLGTAALGICGNYILFLLGLDYITPEASQVLVQLAPMLMLLGGLVVFRERFAVWQWVGLVVLLAGIALFFNHRLEELTGGFGDYALGVLLIVIGSVIWAAYGLAQKQLLNSMGSGQVMLIMYLAGALLFFPMAKPAGLGDLNGIALALLAFTSLNTLFAYGSFAEALAHWEASRVSAVLTIVPLLSLLFVAVLGQVTDAVVPEPLNILSWVGALLVVVGSMLAALAGSRESVDELGAVAVGDG